MGRAITLCGSPLTVIIILLLVSGILSPALGHCVVQSGRFDIHVDCSKEARMVVTNLSSVIVRGKEV